MPDPRDATVSAGSLEWQQVFWPQSLTEAMAFGLLRHWAAQTHAPQLILEARADETGVEYLIGSQLRHNAAVRRAVEQLVGGAIVTSFETDDREHVAIARRILGPRQGERCSVSYHEARGQKWQVDDRCRMIERGRHGERLLVSSARQQQLGLH